MTITEFLNHIKHPEASEVEDITILRDLADRFPYCTSSQVLLAYSLFRDNDLDFPNQLKKVAACASSRKKLKCLFDEFKSFREKIIEPVRVIDSPAQLSLVTNEDVGIPEPPSQSRKHEEDLLSIVRQRLAEIKIEREKKAENEKQVTDSESFDSGKGALSKEEILEKFMRDKPRLSTPKATFFSPSEQAVKSNVDDEEIVTETLARLFYNQGNFTKAIKIYDKLILLFPEKSSYFAAQIEKMTSPPSSSQKEGVD
jgi:tetratricopeptide (TPR) repeat protein